MVVIVRKFCSVEQVCPVVLLVIAEHADVRFEPLVIVLHLSLCLWMICGGEALIDV